MYYFMHLKCESLNPLWFVSRFLLLMSDGLYKSLEEATRTDQVNKDLAQMAVEQVGTDIY